MITIDFKRLEIKPGHKILDIGCGSGRHTCFAYQQNGVFALGADLMFDDLLSAKKNLELHDDLDEHGGGRWAVLNSDAGALPFKSDQFHSVICSEVLEHIPRHEKAIREAVRVLKPGHTLAVSVPRHWPERLCWAFSREYANSEGGHIRIYDTKKLIALLEKNGVKKTGGHFAHSLHTPYWWLKCLVGPDRKDSKLVNLYNAFLTWDLMKKPFLTQKLEYLLNPILGKSTVLYFKKPNHVKERI